MQAAGNPNSTDPTGGTNQTREITGLEDILRPLQNFYRYGVSWLVPSVLIVSVIGTAVCIVVLIKRKTTQPEIRCWFLALSLTDLLTLSVGLCLLYVTNFHYIVGRLLPYPDFRESSAINCYAFSITIFYSLLASSWIQAGISVMRAISTLKPLRSRTLLSYKKVRFGLILTQLTALLVSVSLVSTSVQFTKHLNAANKTRHYCKVKPHYTTFFFYSSLVLKVVLPTLCLVISSILILTGLQGFKKTFHRMETINSATHHPVPSSDKGEHHQCPGTPSAALKFKRSQQRRISHLLLGMNLTFVLFTLPFEIRKIIYKNHTYDREVLFKSPQQLNAMVDDRIAEKAFNIVLYFNNATNWLFYFMLGKRFRQHFYQLLICRTGIFCKGSSSPSSHDNITTPLMYGRRLTLNQGTMGTGLATGGLTYANSAAHLLRHQVMGGGGSPNRQQLAAPSPDKTTPCASPAHKPIMAGIVQLMVKRSPSKLDSSVRLSVMNEYSCVTNAQEETVIMSNTFV